LAECLGRLQEPHRPASIRLWRRGRFTLRGKARQGDRGVGAAAGRGGCDTFRLLSVALAVALAGPAPGRRLVARVFALVELLPPSFRLLGVARLREGGDLVHDGASAGLLRVAWRCFARSRSTRSSALPSRAFCSFVLTRWLLDSTRASRMGVSGQRAT